MLLSRVVDLFSGCAPAGTETGMIILSITHLNPVEFFMVLKCAFCFQSMHLNTSVIGIHCIIHTSHLVHLKALKWLRSNWKFHLWTWMSKCQRNQPSFPFCLWYSEQKAAELVVVSVPLKEKHLKDFCPLLLLHGLHYWQLYKYSVWPLYMYECNAQ